MKLLIAPKSLRYQITQQTKLKRTEQINNRIKKHKYYIEMQEITFWVSTVPISILPLAIRMRVSRE